MAWVNWTCTAALADVATSTDQLSAGQGSLGAAAGAACVFAPFLGNRALRAFGPRGGYFLAAVCSVLAFYRTRRLTETLQLGDQPGAAADFRPGAPLLRVFSAPQSARLAAVLAVQA